MTRCSIHLLGIDSFRHPALLVNCTLVRPDDGLPQGARTGVEGHAAHHLPAEDDARDVIRSDAGRPE